jgi:hypothetical protein
MLTLLTVCHAYSEDHKNVRKSKTVHQEVSMPVPVVACGIYHVDPDGGRGGADYQSLDRV